MSRRKAAVSAAVAGRELRQPARSSGLPSEWLLTLATHRSRTGYRARRQLDRAGSRVELTTSDGIRIAGWLSRGCDPARACLIVCHGYRGSSLQSLPWFKLAARMECSCLAFDFRAHGASEGRATTCGCHEILDLTAAVDYISANRLCPGGLVVCGLSMGASTAIRLAARDPRITAVIAESPYLTLERAAHAWFRSAVGPVGPVLADAMCRAATRRWNIDPAEISPISAAAALSATPLLVLAAGRDKLTPLESVRQIAAAAPLGELLVLPHASHAECWSSDEAAVAAAAEAFLRSAADRRTAAQKPDV